MYLNECDPLVAFCTEAAWVHTGSNPSIPLEQLWWLVRCAGHVLADSADGETPMLPLALAAAATEAAATRRPDPAEGLSRALLETLALALDPAARPVISPRCPSCC